MRQVPADFAPLGAYLIIGDGRLARHLRAYFTLEAIPFETWTRKNPLAALPELAAHASHILLAISDGAIESFLNANSFLKNKVCVHFSGALVTPLAASAHPLMTFTNELYDLQRYRSIPFVLEKGRGSLQALLPGLKNQSFEIDASKKPLYHALCVMSGNFTTLLWEKVFKEFSAEFGLSKEVLTPYLEQTVKNLISSSQNTSVLTGPLARGDDRTIQKHLETLGHDPYADVYRAFVTAYAKSETELTTQTPALFPLGGL